MSNPLNDFDLDDPDFPKMIKQGALLSGGFPYSEKLDSEIYEREMLATQIQLVRLQAHLLETGGRVMVVFEGRDAAGKGGAIGAYRENLNPRFILDVALPKPSDRERTQWYFQRYVDWFPAAGETVLFDRSWYNRAGVERVMNFCTPEETEHFLDEVPRFEHMITRAGIHMFKFWLSIGREMQLKRFHDRRHDPLKSWKISPIDSAALSRWDDYTQARNVMLGRTSSPHAPWTCVLANDKKRARLAVLRTVLHAINFAGKEETAIGAIDEKIVLDTERFLKNHGAG